MPRVLIRRDSRPARKSLTIHSMTNPTQKKIELQNKGYALVDAIDFEWLSEYRWRQTADRRGQGYAAAWDTKLKRTVYMHRLLMGASKGQEVDHKNGDTLDNRRCNLRCATRAQNAANMDKYSSNTSGYKCVFWDKTNKKWKVQM